MALCEMITLSDLKSHWKDILRFCSFHGLGINELILGVLAFQKQGTGGWSSHSISFCSPTPTLGKPACAPALLSSGSSPSLSRCSFLKGSRRLHRSHFVAGSMGRLKEQARALDSGAVMWGPRVETSSWGTLLRNESLLEELFMRAKPKR